jgi:hypothetical protein
MKNILILFLLLYINASADFMKNVTQTHIKSLNTILFFASEDSISSGQFRFKTFDSNLDNYFFPFSFPIESQSDDFHYYLNGSIGFSNYKQNNIDLNRGSIDSYKLHNYAFKLGTGLQYHTSKDTDFEMGVSYIYSFLDAKYKSAIPLSGTTPNDKIINSLLNHTKQYNTFEVSSAFNYHPHISYYKPYSKLSIHHFSTYIDDKYASKHTLNSSILKLKLGLITPSVAELFGLSLTLEPYASVLRAYGDIEDSLDLNTIYVLGNTFHLNAYPVTCWVEDFVSLHRNSMDWVKEITLDINIIKGHNFNGFNIGFGVKF